MSYPQIGAFRHGIGATAHTGLERPAIRDWSDRYGIGATENHGIGATVHTGLERPTLFKAELLLLHFKTLKKIIHKPRIFIEIIFRKRGNFFST